MIDPTPHEILSLERAATAAGQYLETLGLNFSRDVTLEEWRGLIALICETYQASLNEPPF